MTKTTIACVVAVAGLVACMHTDNLTDGDLADAYVSPSVCAELQRCHAVAFELGYPGGLTACEDHVKGALSSDQRAKVSNCTNADGQKCRDDYAAVPCSADGSQEAAPASCTKC